MLKGDQTTLLADEDDAAWAFFATNLTADGYLVRAAEDRSKAIALLSVDQPDLIIADVNGQTLDLLDAVRSGDGLAGHVDPDTPMIVLSQRPDDILRIRVLERGSSAVVAGRHTSAPAGGVGSSPRRGRSPAERGLGVCDEDC